MNPATGVYFRREDYASFWRRVVIDLIDVSVLAVNYVILWILIVVVLPITRHVADIFLVLLLLTSAAYLVVLKRSRFGTLGYRLGRVRIVGLDGNPPSYSSLLLRFVFSALGPLNSVVDLLWLSGDAHRQAIRDKFASTYVVNAGSKPAAEGRIVRRYYHIMSYNCLFREIEASHTAASASQQ